jgi:hypothetical protein
VIEQGGRVVDGHLQAGGREEWHKQLAGKGKMDEAGETGLAQADGRDPDAGWWEGCRIGRVVEVRSHRAGPIEALPASHFSFTAQNSSMHKHINQKEAIRLDSLSHLACISGGGQAKLPMS